MGFILVYHRHERRLIMSSLLKCALVPERSCSGEERSRSYKSTSTDAILVAGGSTLCSASHKFINSEILSRWCEESIPAKRRTLKPTVIIIQTYHCCQHYTAFQPIYFAQRQLYMLWKLLGIITWDLELTDQPLIELPAFVRYWRTIFKTMGEHITY
jgi:hypothetical protein